MLAVFEPAWRVVFALAIFVMGVGCAGAQEHRSSASEGSGAARFSFSVVDAPACPVITSYLVEPQNVFLGHVINVSATATNSADAGTDFVWSASQGFFDNPGAAATVYICIQPGDIDITLRVGSAACGDTIATTVECDLSDAG
jgi:hypothetical protein